MGSSHPFGPNASRVASRVLRGALVLASFAAASCGSGPQPLSEAGYQLRCDAPSYSVEILGQPPAPQGVPATSDGYVFADPIPPSDYLPAGCTGTTAFASSREHVTLDWHCSGKPARVTATLDYVGSGRYGGIGFMNATVDSDDALFGSYFELVSLLDSCITGDCVDNTPFGDDSQLPEAHYSLTSTDPAIALTTPILMRAADQWAPRRCNAQTTYQRDLDGAPAVRIAWQCVYLGASGQDVGSVMSPAYWNGVLQDRDGDGTFEGLLSVDPLTSADTIGPTVVVPFTMTPTR